MRRLILPAVLALLALVSAVIASSANRSQQAASDSSTSTYAVPRLVIDLSRGRIIARMAQVTLREYGITVVQQRLSSLDSSTTENTTETTPQRIEKVYLIDAAEAISKTELDIIAEESGLRPEKLQRYIPRDMVLVTSTGLRIRIETDALDARSNIRVRAAEYFREAWANLVGRDSLHLRMSPGDAMSLLGLSGSKPIVIVRP